jgi:hypothetical protein
LAKSNETVSEKPSFGQRVITGIGEKALIGLVVLAVEVFIRKYGGIDVLGPVYCTAVEILAPHDPLRWGC